MQAEMLDSIVSNSLQLFQDAGFKVRVLMRDGDPWFVAKDVCTCLEIANVSDACSRLDEDERGIVSTDTPSGKQEMLIVSEPGLYSLVGSSKKPEAKAFKRWVNHEVLPSIRKTGGYSVAQPTIFDYARALIAEKERSDALEAQNKALEAERDEAIRIKAMIGSRREATAMATASAKSRECEKLREQLGDSKTYKAATAIAWLPDYFDMSNRGLYGSLAAKLKKLEAEMPPAFAHIDIQDSRWGLVKAYHVAVIERLHEMVQADENLMKKYRKIASV